MSRDALIFLEEHLSKDNRTIIISKQICKLISDPELLILLEEACSWYMRDEENFIGEMYGSDLKEIIPQDELDIEVLNNDNIRIEIV